MYEPIFYYVLGGTGSVVDVMVFIQCIISIIMISKCKESQSQSLISEEIGMVVNGDRQICLNAWVMPWITHKFKGWFSKSKKSQFVIELIKN